MGGWGAERRVYSLFCFCAYVFLQIKFQRLIFPLKMTIVYKKKKNFKGSFSLPAWTEQAPRPRLNLSRWPPKTTKKVVLSLTFLRLGILFSWDEEALRQSCIANLALILLFLLAHNLIPPFVKWWVTFTLWSKPNIYYYPLLLLGAHTRIWSPMGYFRLFGSNIKGYRWRFDQKIS